MSEFRDAEPGNSLPCANSKCLLRVEWDQDRQRWVHLGRPHFAHYPRPQRSAQAKYPRGAKR